MSDNYIGQSPGIPVPTVGIFSGGHLYGGALANFAGDLVNDISVTAGECRDATNTFDIRWPLFTSKQLDVAWAAGSGAGMRDASPLVDGTWNIFAIRDTATGNAADILASASLTPTLPSGYNAFRRLGAVLRVGATILAFTQDGDDFWLKTPILNFAGAGVAAGQLQAMSVPLGVRVRLYGVCGVNGGAGGSQIIYVSDPQAVDIPPSTSGNPLGHVIWNGAVTTTIGGSFTVWTNTAAQMRRREFNTEQARYASYGWMDTRGRLAP